MFWFSKVVYIISVGILGHEKFNHLGLHLVKFGFGRVHVSPTQ